MKVLVLLSTYNGEQYLREQIDSILNQSGVEIGILIRDDGSKDNTISILRDYEAHFPNVIVDYGKNVGCTESYRRLLDASYDKLQDYDYFAFSDQDDFWLPEKVQIGCEIIVGLPEDKPCMYCSNVRVVDEQLNYINMKWSPDESFITKPQSLVWSMAYGCTMVFNKKVVEMFHQYPPQRMIYHDLWVMHMCMFFGTVAFDTNSYISYRQHGDNVVGAKTTFKSRMLCHWKSLHHLTSQHDNEYMAQELLRAYDGILSNNDKEMIGIVANYRKSLGKRLRFLFGIGNYCGQIRRKKDNIWLYWRIILGKV